MSEQNNEGNMEDYKRLMAKTDPSNQELWLPLWMHLKDTAEIMRKLVHRWLTESTIMASGLSYETFVCTAVFIAAIHDIGKITSYFQSVITEHVLEKREELILCGFCIQTQYSSAGKTPHAFAGQWILQSGLPGLESREDIANIIGAHHGRTISSGNINAEENLLKVYTVNFYGKANDTEQKKKWEEAWRTAITEGLQYAGLKSINEIPHLSLQAQILLSGLLIMADWLASNTDYFPLIDIQEYGTESKYPERVTEAWKRISIPEGWHSEIYQMDDELFQKRFIFPPNEVQTAMYKIINQCTKPGIFILEAQMGIGKTEAAFAGAEVLAARNKAGGIFLGLPTQATSNGLFDRLLSWAQNISEQTVSSICLAHSAAEFNDSYNQLMMQGRALVDDVDSDGRDVEVHPWFQGNKRALLADFVLGTVDQFLMASLKRKYFMLRHLGLTGKVVIIDECHAYDTYMNQYLEQSLQWMASYGVPVILLSATLPAERRCHLVNCYVKAYSKYYLRNLKRNTAEDSENWKDNTGYPLLTWTDGETVKQELISQNTISKIVKIESITSLEEMAQKLDWSLKNGGCACVIVNTVQYAQKIFSYLQETITDAEIALYHAQYIMPHRAEKEKYILSRIGKDSDDKSRYRFVLVGTQVLEQSLDYDADLMITQLCPIDLLFQRIGRLHRHNRKTRPERVSKPKCFILRENEEQYDEGTKAIYGDFLLRRTDNVLEKELNVPKDIPTLVQKVYQISNDLGMEPEWYRSNYELFQKKQQEQKESARGYLLTHPLQEGLRDILSNSKECSDTAAEASVRDGDSSIEVLLMKYSKDGKIHFVYGNNENDMSFSSDYVPSTEEGRMIAKQRLRLPHIFCSRWNIHRVIQELEDQNRKMLPLWQQSSWIRGELVLLLDEKQETALAGYKLCYSAEQGLQYRRLEEKDVGKRI
jgi:CRISPR-associated endonuclease/helicase Cas3